MLPRRKESVMSRFMNWFRPFSQNRPACGRARKRGEPIRLGIEALEERQLLSTTSALVVPKGTPAPVAVAATQPALSLAGLYSRRHDLTHLPAAGSCVERWPHRS